MTHQKPADYDHLMRHARARFPGASITITHTEDERIHIDADGDSYTFDIGSDDDQYLFVGRLCLYPADGLGLTAQLHIPYIERNT